MEKTEAAAELKTATAPDTPVVSEQKLLKSDSQVEAQPGDCSHVEYTELALECLDLKAQEKLLLPPLSGN